MRDCAHARERKWGSRREGRRAVGRVVLAPPVHPGTGACTCAWAPQRRAAGARAAPGMGWRRCGPVVADELGPLCPFLGAGRAWLPSPLPGVQSARAASGASRPSLTGPRRPCPVLSGQVIKNYLEACEPLSSEPRLSRLHFHDNQRKVDYVLVYHYRKRGAHPDHGSPGHSLAIVSNGETSKDPDAGAPGDIEPGPLDALEEERKEQREEFEHNLLEAGLELEKDLEVRSGRWQRVRGGMAKQAGLLQEALALF